MPIQTKQEEKMNPRYRGSLREISIRNVGNQYKVIYKIIYIGNLKENGRRTYVNVNYV